MAQNTTDTVSCCLRWWYKHNILKSIYKLHLNVSQWCLGRLQRPRWWIVLIHYWIKRHFSGRFILKQSCGLSSCCSDTSRTMLTWCGDSAPTLPLQLYPRIKPRQRSLAWSPAQESHAHLQMARRGAARGPQLRLRKEERSVDVIARPEQANSGVCNFFMVPLEAHRCFSVKANSFHSVAAVKRHCLRLVLSNIRDKLTRSRLHERSC